MNIIRTAFGPRPDRFVACSDDDSTVLHLHPRSRLSSSSTVELPSCRQRKSPSGTTMGSGGDTARNKTFAGRQCGQTRLRTSLRSASVNSLCHAGDVPDTSCREPAQTDQQCDSCYTLNVSGSVETSSAAARSAARTISRNIPPKMASWSG